MESARDFSSNSREPTEQKFTHFQNQVSLGKEIQEILKDIRFALRLDPFGETPMYSSFVENFEIVMSPYIALDDILNAESQNSYKSRIKNYLFLVWKKITSSNNKYSKIQFNEVLTLINDDPTYRLGFAKKKFSELMNLLARHSLLPIPSIFDVIQTDEFETYAGNEEQRIVSEESNGSQS